MSIYGGVFALSNIVVGFIADLFHIPKSCILTFSLFGMSVTSVVFIFCDSFLLFATLTSLFSICNGKYLEVYFWAKYFWQGVLFIFF